MAIATLGDIVFEVSDTKIFTIDNLSRDVKMRYVKHDVIGSKPITENVGPDLQDIKFKMILSASLGVAPLSTMKQIYNAFNDSTAMSFMIGEQVIGSNKWVITDFTEGYSQIDNQGIVWRMEVDVTLQEYVEMIATS